MLEWRCPTPYPWEEHNPPMYQQFMIAAWRSLIVLWSGVALLVPWDLVPGKEENSLISVGSF